MWIDYNVDTDCISNFAEKGIEDLSNEELLSIYVDTLET